MKFLNIALIFAGICLVIGVFLYIESKTIADFPMGIEGGNALAFHLITIFLWSATAGFIIAQGIMNEMLENQHEVRK